MRQWADVLRLHKAGRRKAEEPAKESGEGLLRLLGVKGKRTKTG